MVGISTWNQHAIYHRQNNGTADRRKRLLESLTRRNGISTDYNDNTLPAIYTEDQRERTRQNLRF